MSYIVVLPSDMSPEAVDKFVGFFQAQTKAVASDRPMTHAEELQAAIIVLDEAKIPYGTVPERCKLLIERIKARNDTIAAAGRQTDSLLHERGRLDRLLADQAEAPRGVVEDVGRAGDMARQLLQEALTALDRVHDHENTSFVRPIRTDLEKFLMDPTGAVILPRAPPYPTPMHVVAKAADSTPSAETSAGRFARIEKIHPLPSHFQIGEAVSVSFDDHQDESKPPSTLKHLDIEGHVYAVRFTEGKVWYDIMTYHSDTLLRDLDSIAVFANTELENRHGAPRRTFG